MVRFPRAAGLRAPLFLLFCVFGPAANAQFKEIGPPPFSPAVAHQRIRTLLDNVEPANRQQTIDTLNGLTPWFRNILDEELIAGWQRDGRERLTLVMEPLADARVAAEVVEFSWRKRTDATLNPAYAPMLGHLMARYPESGKTFLADLLGPVPPAFSTGGGGRLQNPDRHARPGNLEPKRAPDSAPLSCHSRGPAHRGQAGGRSGEEVSGADVAGPTPRRNAGRH